MRVNVDELARMETEFQNAAKKMTDVHSTLFQLTRTVGQENVTERFQPAIENVARAAVGYTRDLIILKGMLEDIVTEYSRTEQAIVDNLKDTQIFFHRWPTGLIPLPEYEMLPSWVEWNGEDMIIWVPWFQSN